MALTYIAAYKASYSLVHPSLKKWLSKQAAMLQHEKQFSPALTNYRVLFNRISSLPRLAHVGPAHTTALAIWCLVSCIAETLLVRPGSFAVRRYSSPTLNRSDRMLQYSCNIELEELWSPEVITKWACANNPNTSLPRQAMTLFYAVIDSFQSSSEGDLSSFSHMSEIL